MEKGDFVRIEFTGTVTATGDVFDTTSEEEAKKLGIHNKDHPYGPVLVIVGAHMVPHGVEDQLKEMKVSEEKEFDLSPDKAFGPRNPKMVKIMSLAKFHQKQINPVPGLFVDIDGMQAKVRSVSGGRVVVDFNHPLAGRELHYRLKIVKQVTDTLEKAESLIRYYNIGADVSFKEGILTLKMEKPVQQDAFKDFLEKSIKEWISEVKELKFESTGNPAPAQEPAPGHESRKHETQ